MYTLVTASMALLVSERATLHRSLGSVRAGTISCEGWRRRSSSSRNAEMARLAQIDQACNEGKISEFEAARINGVGGPAAATYGEITPKGFTTLALRLGLDERSHFADLGSGTGRAVIQAAAQFNVASCVGVEMSTTRHERALLALEESTATDGKVTFMRGDCASDAVWAAGGPLSSTTDVWLCSLLFGNDLMSRLADRIAECPTIRRVATLKTFPDGLDGYREDERVEPCEMSWTAKLVIPSGAASGFSPVHIYHRI